MADNRLSGCRTVVGAESRKWGHFGGICSRLSTPDGLVGLVRKKRNYDCFDDQQYNEVDDVEVLAHNVGFVLLQGI